MYICDFSRSEGAGRAIRRNTRGLTRSVIALIVPPFPAASRPSNTTMTRRPLALTQSWRTHSFACSFRSSFAYAFSFIFFGLSSFAIASSLLLLPAAAERAVEGRAGAQLRAARVGEQQLLLEQILVRRENLDVARQARVVPRPREVGRILQHGDGALALDAHLRERLDRDERVGDLAIPVQRGLLIRREGLIELRLRRFEIALVATRVVDRLQKAGADRERRAGAAEEVREVAGHAAAERGQRDRRIEQRFRRADVGVRRDEQLLRFHHVRTPLEQR